MFDFVTNFLKLETCYLFWMKMDLKYHLHVSIPLWDHGVNCSVCTFEILTHSKLKAIPPSGIYKLTCNTCQGVCQTGRSTDARYKEHIRYIRTNNPQSAYALHILDNRHEYGEQERIMELVKACRKGKLMNCWESLYLQGNHSKGYLITEQL